MSTTIPPLVAGDKLTRAEFLRRWEAHPEIKNAELIGGIVYMASPVSAEHGDTEFDVGTWLGTYKTATPGTAGGHNTTSFLLDDTPQPDINLRIRPEYGGSSWVEGRYLQGVPELLTEICRSSASYDLHGRSRIFPGLWLDGTALLAGNMQQVLARLQEGLHSPEHDRFVAELASRKTAGA